MPQAPKRSSPPGKAGGLLDNSPGLGAPTWPQAPKRSSPPGKAGGLLDYRLVPASWRVASSVASSAGKKDSIRSSCRVMSWGVPRLVSVVK